MNELVLVPVLEERDESRLSMEIAEVVLELDGMVVVERELVDNALLVEERNVVYVEELEIAIKLLAIEVFAVFAKCLLVAFMLGLGEADKS